MNHTRQCGFFYNLPFEEYRTLSGLNQSRLRQALSPASKLNKGYQIQQAMNFGSAGHCLLLEPENFANLYVCAPKGTRKRGKDGKKRWEEFCKLNPGKNVLTANEWNQLQNIRKVFQLNPKIRQLWKHGETEVSMFWQDAEFALECKARMDWFDADSRRIVDLKFTNNIGKVSAQKLIDQHFAVQACWYRRGVYQLTKKLPDFIFVFLEKYAPHNIRVINVTEDIFRHGEQTIKNALINSELKPDG